MKHLLILILCIFALDIQSCRRIELDSLAAVQRSRHSQCRRRGSDNAGAGLRGAVDFVRARVGGVAALDGSYALEDFECVLGVGSCHVWFLLRKRGPKPPSLVHAPCVPNAVKGEVQPGA